MDKTRGKLFSNFTRHHLITDGVSSSRSWGSPSANLSPNTFWICVARLNRPLQKQKRKLLNGDNANACANASTQEIEKIGHPTWTLRLLHVVASLRKEKKCCQIREVNRFAFHQMMQRKRRMETSKDAFATFWNDKRAGAEMCPVIASGIVTENAPVSYWPMLLAIITISTCAELHSKTVSGFACVASVSVRFRSKESKTARKPIFYFLAIVPLLAWPKPKIPFLVVPRSFFAPKPHRNACNAGYIRV